MKEKISETAKVLLQTKIGYRNEDRSTGVYTIDEIIHHETKELENEDIFDTCLKLYGESNPHTVLQNHFKDEPLWGMWLGRKEDILEHYAEDAETELSMYRIPDDAIILSDLGEEGVLFAFKEYPNDLFFNYEWVLYTKSVNQKWLEETKEKINDYIEHYGDYVNDFNISPFEHLNAWMIRDKLETYNDILNENQREKLKEKDEILYQNATNMHDYLRRIYDFGNSKEIPLKRWWWHLDKIKNNTLNIDL